MTCLLIASKSFCDGQLIAARVADLLEIRLLGQEVFRAAAAEYAVTEEQLRRAIVEPPSLFGMTGTRRARCLAYFTASLTRLIGDGNAVYHGPAAHHVIPGIPHLIRISITGDPAKRAERLAARESLQLARANKRIADEDNAQERCAELIFDVEPTTPTRFDLEFKVDDEGVEEAARQIVQAAGEPRFRPTNYSNRCLDNIVLVAQIRAKLVDRDPNIQVLADNGVVSVRPHLTGRARERALTSIRQELSVLPDIRSLEIVPVISGDLFGRSLSL